MRKFKYIGKKETLTVFGIEFPRGKAVEVKDEFVAKKLAGNSHFEEVTK